MMYDTYQGGSAYDYESQSFFTAAENNKIQRRVRHGFIRKVYSIFLTQILVTAVVTAFLCLNPTLSQWSQTAGQSVALVSSIVAIVLLISLICSENLRKSVPINYGLLFLFTICEALGVGSTCSIIASRIGIEVVLQAVILTTGMMIALTFFAFQTTYDFVSWIGGMFYLFVFVTLFGLCRLFFPRNPIVETIYASVMVVVVSIYILIDTQLLAGKGRVQCSIDEYILAALTLYVDFITLFLYILKLLADSQTRNQN